MALTSIATWNVNSLRVRLPQLGEWLASAQPDIIALQETKLPDPDFPTAEIAALGYEVAFSGQRTYNGVAVLSREPVTVLATEIPGFPDEQRRVLAVDTGGLRVINLYGLRQVRLQAALARCTPGLARGAGARASPPGRAG
jgi:exodeoxyribonuclease-3